MAAELSDLRGIPTAIQNMFDDQRSKASPRRPEPLLTLPQWKAWQETNKKERCLPATPKKKPGLFTAASKVRLTPRQILAPSPKQASTAASVSSDCPGVLAAIVHIDSSASEADRVTHLSLSSGCTVPIEAERVRKPAAMSCTCATKYFAYFDDDDKEGLTLLTDMLQKFSMSTRAKEQNAMLDEMLKAWNFVTW